MEVVIFCGGQGSRLAEETKLKPKPMVEIGGKPILWHIMKTYSLYGYKKFILALGYKGNYIKEYFYNSRISQSDFIINLNPESAPTFLTNNDESDWEITFIDTGESTLKGSRLKKIEKYIRGDNFFVTYGDGVSNVNIDKLFDFHLKEKGIATLTAVNPPSRFGEITLDGNNVLNFQEKPQMNTGLINGGFFVFNKEIFKYLTANEDCDLEFGALQELANNSLLKAYVHNGFWQCMDNVRERDYLNQIYNDGNAKWLIK